MGLDKDDIKQLIAILQKGLVDSDDDSDDTEPEEVVESRPSKKSSNKPKPKKKKSNNKFDNMSEKNMHKDDIEIDRKLRKFPPTSRTRNYKPIKVKCRVCSREENVNPSLVESMERYKCNKCSTSSG